MINFDQILTKYAQMLIISVKNHSIHVKKIQERNCLEIKKNNVNKSHRIWGGEIN